MKLQCLHAALIQRGDFTKGSAVAIAEAINAGFEKIAFNTYESTQHSTEAEKMREYIREALSAGYDPEHAAIADDWALVDELTGDALIREHGKAGQWHDLVGDSHGPTFNKPQVMLFQEAAEPLIKYLCENHNPHTSVIVTCTSAELVTGERIHRTEEFLKD